jgi:hypothetical protein
MAAPRGHKYNTKGRPGAKGKKTVQWEIFSAYMLEGGLVRFEKELKTLEAKEFVRAMIDLMEFFKPKLSRQSLVDGEGNALFPKPIMDVVPENDGDKKDHEPNRED